MAFTFDEIQSWSADELNERLAGAPEEVAAILAAGAQAGVRQSQTLYGQILLDGRGLPADPVEALRWFGIAAKAGDAMAMNMVGRCCENGWGTRVDPVLAAQWYRAAANQNLDWGMYNLATLLCLGVGVAQDRAEALALYRQAAALGHAKSVNMIGGFYEDGWVVGRDMEVAAAHYLRAAEAGDFRGQFNHARMLAESGDIGAARIWLQRIPETATDAFMEKVRLWLAGRPDVGLSLD